MFAKTDLSPHSCPPPTHTHDATLLSLAVAALGVDNSWSLAAFQKSVRFDIGPTVSDEVLEFDLVHADPALANALRRIMISEVRDRTHPNISSFSRITTRHTYLPTYLPRS